MAEEVRVYRSTGLLRAIFVTVFLLGAIPLLAAVIEALLPGLAASKRGYMAAEMLRLILPVIPVFLVLLIVSIWVSVFLKLPRLELTSHSIRYLTFRYSLEAAWEDVERIEMFTRKEIYAPAQSFKSFKWKRITVDVGRGLVASKYRFQLTKWGRLIENYWYPKYQGIQIEPYFARNIYLGDLRNDMKQHIPHVFENIPYLV